METHSEKVEPSRFPWPSVPSCKPKHGRDDGRCHREPEPTCFKPGNYGGTGRVHNGASYLVWGVRSGDEENASKVEVRSAYRHRPRPKAPEIRSRYPLHNPDSPASKTATLPKKCGYEIIIFILIASSSNPRPPSPTKARNVRVGRDQLWRELDKASEPEVVDIVYPEQVLIGEEGRHGCS